VRVIVMDETTDIVCCGVHTRAVYAHESCGKCVPCREGGILARTGIMKRLVDGHGTTRSRSTV
jgi:NADH-quinone oxidoreductase subunit F